MLKVRDLHAGYGKADVLHGVSFDVNAGECVALVGANGAGKSTTLKCICGLVGVRGGSIEFEGRRIDGLPGHAIVRLGITMCPEGRQVFPDMSVLENLEMGAHVRRDRAAGRRPRGDDGPLPGAALPRAPERRHAVRRRAGDAGHRTGADVQAQAVHLRRALAGPGAEDRRRSRADAGPHQGAWASPSCWWSRTPRWRLRLADRAYVYEAGEIVLQGTGTELQAHPEVSKAYLGY